MRIFAKRWHPLSTIPFSEIQSVMCSYGFAGRTRPRSGTSLTQGSGKGHPCQRFLAYPIDQIPRTR